MWKNYLSAAIRNFLRNGAYSAINLFGLALGFAAAILIVLIVRDEVTYDRFLPDYQLIYRVSETIEFPGRSPSYSSTTFASVAASLKRRFPQIQVTTRLVQSHVAVQHDAAHGWVDAYWADPDFFRVFPFRTLSGNLAEALSQPDGIVLTRATAHQFFGRDAVTGELLRLDDKHTMRVTAVIENLPSNTHLNIQAIASGLAAFSRLKTLDALAQRPDAIKTEDVYTYVKLYPGATAEALNASLRALAAQNSAGPSGETHTPRYNLTFSLVPITEIHFLAPSTGEMKPPGDRRTIHALLGIACLIVIVAVCNFVCMMSARAAHRAMEVAVRKAMGATRPQLVVQFLGESVLYAIAALVLAMIAVELLLPAFNRIWQREIAFDYIHDPFLAVGLLATAVISGLAAGTYPALVQSMHRPCAVLEGVVFLPPSGSAHLRRFLVICQFGTLIALLASTLTIQRQMQYAIEERFRLPADQIYLVNSGCRPGFKESVARLRGVRTAACASDSAIAFGRLGTTLTTQEGSKVVFRLAPIEDANFFRAFGIAPLAGRLFAQDHDADEILRENVTSGSNPSIVINEMGARALGYATANDALGHFPTWSRIGLVGTEPRIWDALYSQIIGVVPNFSLGSVRTSLEPTVYYIDPGLADDLIVALDGHDMPRTLRACADLWTRQSRMDPLEGMFLSQYVNNLYADVMRQSRLFYAFSAVTVVIAALGLFGLAVFTAERRTREIGLRKAFGASRLDILRFLGWEFIRPVLWANCIAWPLAYVFLRRWLGGFAYHVDLNPLTFLSASLIALSIAAATVSGHAFLAARSRPAPALRHK